MTVDDDRLAVLNLARGLFDCGRQYAGQFAGFDTVASVEQERADNYYARLKVLIGLDDGTLVTSRYADPIIRTPDDGTVYRNVDQIIKANRLYGHHWFSPATVRAFNSRTYGSVHFGRYFISSEQMEPGAPRTYKVRYADHLGGVTTVDGQDLDDGSSGFSSYTAAIRWLTEQVRSGALRSYGPSVDARIEVPDGQ